MRFITLIIWFVLFMAGMDISLALINESSTIANIAGFIFLAIVLWASIKTECLTNIKRNKNEKNN